MNRLVGLSLVALCGTAQGQVVAYSFAGQGDDGSSFSYGFTVDVDASTIFVDDSAIGVILYNPALLSASFDVAGNSFTQNDAGMLSGLLSVSDGAPDPDLADVFALSLSVGGSPVSFANMVLASGDPDSMLTTSLDFPTMLDVSLTSEASISFGLPSGVFRGTVTSASVEVIPAPATAGLLAVGGLFAGRRRR